MNGLRRFPSQKLQALYAKALYLQCTRFKECPMLSHSRCQFGERRGFRHMIRRRPWRKLPTPTVPEWLKTACSSKRLPRPLPASELKGVRFDCQCTNETRRWRQCAKSPERGGQRITIDRQQARWLCGSERNLNAV